MLVLASAHTTIVGALLVSFEPVADTADRGAEINRRKHCDGKESQCKFDGIWELQKQVSPIYFGLIVECGRRIDLISIGENIPVQKRIISAEDIPLRLAKIHRRARYSHQSQNLISHMQSYQIFDCMVNFDGHMLGVLRKGELPGACPIGGGLFCVCQFGLWRGSTG
jgi:hypothetical protein